MWYDSYEKLAAFQVNFSDGSSLRTIATTNKEGDVLGLYSLAGEQLVSYEYDSWGNLISFTDNSGVGIGTLNPIRYRGYYFDEETGLYYLQSRYYDPQTGRFLNADGYVSTGQGLLGNNMFIYCGNNPISRYDLIGEGWFSDFYDGLKKFLIDFTGDYEVKNKKSSNKSFNSSVSIEDFKNHDGSYSFYSNNRNGNKFFTETIATFNSKMEFTSDKELGFSLSGTLLTGGWQGKIFGLNLFDFGHADISAYVSSDDIYVGAFASVYSPDFSFTINGTKIELGLELGSIGGKFHKQGNKKTFQAGMLFGFTISWE